MSRSLRFTFMLSTTERELLATLAKQLERTQSDTIRYVINKAAQDFAIHTQPNHFPSVKQSEEIGNGK